jgi:hypothetical protein
VIIVTGATIFQLSGTFSDMPLPHYYIAVNISLVVVKNFDGETGYDHKNQAILETSSQNKVFSVIATAND